VGLYLNPPDKALVLCVTGPSLLGGPEGQRISFECGRHQGSHPCTPQGDSIEIRWEAIQMCLRARRYSPSGHPTDAVLLDSGSLIPCISQVAL
jgi:hypothetical protein